ncbi:MAG: hypothetical protein JO251_20545 [Verrucomicrobia bacterium]|nr:hypothetical protein [Verrucomicrobiota bacterium]
MIHQIWKQRILRFPGFGALQPGNYRRGLQPFVRYKLLWCADRPMQKNRLGLQYEVIDRQSCISKIASAEVCLPSAFITNW